MPEGVPELKRLALFSVFFILFSLAAIAQPRNQQLPGAPRSGPLHLTGVATNGTTNKPAAGDSVVLLKPGQNMEEVARTKIDSRGQFSLTIPEDGMPIHAIRVNHQGVDFVKPVRSGETSVQITVYDAEPIVDSIRVVNQSEVFQTEGSTLHGVELFVIENKSVPPKAQPSFQFYLPDGAAMEDGQALSGELMPVRRAPVPMDEKNKYEFRYPLRPGVTQFEVRYSIPYTGTLKLNSKAAGNVDEFYVVVPKSMTFNGGGSGFRPEQWPIEPGLAVDTNAIDHPEAGKQIAYEISGAGRFPDAPSQTASNGNGNGNGRGGAAQDNRPGGGMGIPNSSPIPLGDSSKWYFLGVLTIFLAGGGVIVFFVNRQPADPAAAMAMSRAPQERSAALLEALKEEIFQLESERVKNKITQQDYDKAKAALDNTLQRAMRRQG
jgi:hypothetical protein